MIKSGPVVPFSLLATCLLGVASCASEPVVTEYVGQLDERLSAPERPFVYERLRPLPRGDTTADGLNLSQGARVFAGKWRLAPLTEQMVLLIEDGDRRWVATDVNRDGKLTDDERFELAPLTDNEYFSSEVLLQIAASHPRFDRFPVLVREPIVEAMPGDGSLRFLWRSVMASVEGTVTIGERQVRLRYDGFHPVSGKLDPRRSGQGVDTDGDGVIVADPRSPEWAYAEDEAVIFRIGDVYISTRDLDLEAGKVVLSSHDASEYERVELVIGQTVPDFNFVDFEGRLRDLSEFRGKPLLLDFWGAWCGPCIAEIPHLKKAYERFHSQGFDILGLDFDPASRKPTPEQLSKGLERARKVVAQHGLQWSQARTQSILDLIRKYRTTAFPTMVLLDSGGKIVSAGAQGHPPLRGPELIETLQILMASEQAGR